LKCFYKFPFQSLLNFFYPLFGRNRFSPKHIKEIFLLVNKCSNYAFLTKP
jgi:hypothetical protein